LLSSALVFAQVSRADEGAAYLDPPYPNLVHPTDGDALPDGTKAPAHSDIAGMLAKMTPVRMQGSRGTCSIFASTAMLEAMLVIRRGLPNDINLSEQWLEYQIMRTQGSEGSWSSKNFASFVANGTTDEALMPYNTVKWEDLSSAPEAQATCGHLTDFNLTACLLGQRDPRLMAATDAQLSSRASGLFDPDFLAARQRAFEVRSSLLNNVGSYYAVSSVAQVKSLLAAGIPVTVDLRFYYGAWNHRKAPDIGLWRNMDHWNHGIVGYPEPGSVDRRRSPEMPAGHSVLVVGYDDDVRVTIPVWMDNGQYQYVTYQGVYYIKNSWGTEGFGSQFQYGGTAYPGYGMMVQKYAHDFGSFYQLPLN
jgi:hypothetical protein